MIFASAFSIIVGVGMIGQWAFSYFSKQIPELEHEPIRIWFHIAAEMATAMNLIVGGLGLLLNWGWGKDIYFIAMGMLFYTAIVSPGYFAQKGQWAWLGIFAVVFLLGIAGVLQVV
ncbi:MAG: hypothetical protein JXA42_09735 [Anaerolineales bacterium]|nr:hypothetical protein [Anaerolineales bacterium]